VGGAFTTVSCPTASDCVAGGSGPTVFSTTDGGASWNATVVSGLDAVMGISCPSADVCEALGSAGSGDFPTQAVFGSTDGGVTWSPQALPGGSATWLAAISCTSTSDCAAVPTTGIGGSVWTTDGGGLWSAAPASADTTSYTGVSCAGSTCLAVGSLASAGAAAVSTDGGATWSADPLPAGTPPLQSVSCPSATICDIGGYAGGTATILTTDDAGTMWSANTFVSGLSQFDAVSCGAPTLCVGLAYDSLISRAVIVVDEDGTVTQTPEPAASVLQAVSCAATTVCVAVGEAPVPASTNMTGIAFTTGDGGATWTQPTLPPDVTDLDGVSCPTTSDCTAVGAYDGAGGTGPVALGSTDGGTTWTAESVPAGASMSAVSCTSASQCVSVEGQGQTGTAAVVDVENGSTWGTETITGMSRADGVSCISAWCTVVGTGSATSVDGGGTWTVTSTSGTDQYGPVSCATTSTCVAVVPGRDWLMGTSDGGADWTPEAVPAVATSLAGVACPSADFCAAVGAGPEGAALLDTVGSGPSVTTSSLAPATVGAPYSQALAATGGTAPYTWAIMPATASSWATIDPTTGVVSGTPTAGSTMDLSIEVTDADGRTGSTTLPLDVTAPDLYTAVSPERICDTRAGNPSGLSGLAAQCNGIRNAGTRLTPGGPMVIGVGGSDLGVPSGATAVAVNVTVVDPSGPGYVSVYPTGSTPPTASVLNFRTGQVVANLVETGLGANDEMSLVSDVATDVVIDLEGYVAPGSDGEPGYFTPLTSPARICDTRAGNPSGLSGGDAQCNGVDDLGTGLSPHDPADITVDGDGGVPTSGVSAVVLNVTVVDPVAAGYLTVFPEGTAAPTTSNINFTRGQSVPNRVIVPVSADGQVSLVSNQATGVLVDVSGWYSSSGDTGSTFTPERTPVRICDTRAGNPSGLSGGDAQCDGAGDAGTTLGPDADHPVTVAGLSGIPADASAVVLNVTAVGATADTYLTVFPGGTAPTESDLNPVPGAARANLVVARLSADGTVTVLNHAGSVDVVVDVEGYYS